MKNLKIVSYVLGTYVIDDITVDICFTSPVVSTFYSSKDLISEDKELLVFNEIFQLIESRVKKLRTFTMWYDLIEYRGKELVWKSSYSDKKKIMFVEVLRAEKSPPILHMLN